MIDINLLRKHPEVIKEICRLRNYDLNIDHLYSLDQKYRSLLTAIEELRSARKQGKGQEDAAQLKDIKIKLLAREKELKEIEHERKTLLDRVPNLLAPDTPIGDSDANNIEISHWSKPPKFSFTPKSHLELGSKLNILDLERGTKASGRGFYYFIADGVKLFRAVYAFVEDFLNQQGFVSLRTPILTKQAALYGTGYLPFFAAEIFGIENKDLALIGTSEQSILAYHAAEIIDQEKLPLLYCAFSPCFRTEAGASGRAAKGAFRVHQFHKLEQIVICHPKDSTLWHKQCQKNAEEIMRLLEIPYRVVRVCAGDLGAPGYKKYDIEGWFAGFSEFRETHSNTNILDYQSRRLNLRCQDKHKKKFFPHTISATAVTDRVILALMENNQTETGDIKIPKILAPYMGGQTIITPKNNQPKPKLTVTQTASTPKATKPRNSQITIITNSAILADYFAAED